MHNKPASKRSHEETISYQQLRTFIGLTGLLLPILLVVGCLLKQDGTYSFHISISHYYYTKMHILFVGMLCVLGGFLVSYKGKAENKYESEVSNFAGWMAFAVAAFPTAFDGFRISPGHRNNYLLLRNEVTPFMGYLHFAFAGLLFTCFVVFCLKYFMIPDEAYTGEEARKFEQRKLVYRVCGYGIMVSIVLLFGLSFIHNRPGLLRFSTFIFETTSLWFFGYAWLVKGSKYAKRIPAIGALVAPLR